MSGLLGALAGAGEAIAATGRTMFANQLEIQRENRLQAIRDKEYARARKDQLADQRSNRAFQTSERMAGQDFMKERIGMEFDNQKTLLTESNTARQAYEEWARDNLPQGEFAKLLFQRDQAAAKGEAGVSELAMINKAINVQLQDVMVDNNPYTGETTYTQRTFDEQGNPTGIQIIGRTGGYGRSSSDPDTASTVISTNSPPPPSTSADQIAAIQAIIDAGPGPGGMYAVPGQSPMTLRQLERAIAALQQ